MPAAIASDGSVDLFASFREPAWHGLGTVFDTEVTDYREMLRLAGLDDWDAREMPIGVVGTVYDEDAGDYEDTLLDAEFVVPAKAIVATIGGLTKVLGVTGDRYEIIQNEDAFSFLQSLHDGARWETAGAIKDGRVVFGSMAFDRDFVLDPSGVADKVESYLLVHTSHDGSTAIGGGITPTRVVCQNTLNVAIGNVKNTFKMRHTSTVSERMKAEAALWRQANTYMDTFQAEAQTLFAQSVTDKDYFSIVENLFPKPEEDKRGSLAKWEKRQEVYAQAWKGAPNEGIRGTAWGVANALTEANQWGRNVRKGDKGQENFLAAGAGFDIPTNQFRAQAFEIARSLVTA
jgi:phage/plasmid-like protein (TIGR03299 family)